MKLITIKIENSLIRSLNQNSKKPML